MDIYPTYLAAFSAGVSTYLSGTRTPAALPAYIMRYHTAAIAPFVVTVSTIVSIMSIGASAARHRVSVSEDNIDFKLDYFDDARSRPFRVIFDGNARNKFDFEASGIVKIIRIGTERYRVSYCRTSHT